MMRRLRHHELFVVAFIELEALIDVLPRKAVAVVPDLTGVYAALGQPVEPHFEHAGAP